MTLMMKMSTQTIMINLKRAQGRKAHELVAKLLEGLHMVIARI